MLRLENLFDRLGQLIGREAPVDHHFALATIFEIMDVASRADLKSDLLKDLERQKAQLNGYRGNPSISEAALDRCWAGRPCLQRAQPAAGQGRRRTHERVADEHPAARISIPGGTCEFDLPATTPGRSMSRRASAPT